MLIRYGFKIEIDIPQETTILTALDIEAGRRGEVVEEQAFSTTSVAKSESYIDSFGNNRSRLHAMPGTVTLALAGVVRDDGLPDAVPVGAEQVPVSELPAETLSFLLASRYCDTEFLNNIAWFNFGGYVGGWSRVPAICDFVHNRLVFSYPDARPTRTAMDAYNERTGVCRDFTHLAVALCRCMNIPARYCNGYLGDIGILADPTPMDFNAWFEAYLGGRWYTFDARHNMPRIGRVVVDRGRDAMDIPMIHTFGPHTLRRFEDVTEEVAGRN